MSSFSPDLRKAKIAERVIEVLDYFGDGAQEASVMDIVRRYDRPQSSTSDLMQCLVELGLLRKDAKRRCYSLTTRAGLLGKCRQADPLVEAKLIALLDELCEKSGRPAAAFSRIDARVQIIARRVAGRQKLPATGSQTALTGSAAGWLLLSTCGPIERSGLVRRLNADTIDEARISPSVLSAAIERSRKQGYAFGPVGFGARGSLLAALLPLDVGPQPLVVGLACGMVQTAYQDQLFQLLRATVSFHFDGAAAVKASNAA